MRRDICRSFAVNASNTIVTSPDFRRMRQSRASWERSLLAKSSIFLTDAIESRKTKILLTEFSKFTMVVALLMWPNESVSEDSGRWA
jgi:hypothetical protein